MVGLPLGIVNRLSQPSTPGGKTGMSDDEKSTFSAQYYGPGGGVGRRKEEDGSC